MVTISWRIPDVIRVIQAITTELRIPIMPRHSSPRRVKRAIPHRRGPAQRSITHGFPPPTGTQMASVQRATRLHQTIRSFRVPMVAATRSRRPMDIIAASGGMSTTASIAIHAIRMARVDKERVNIMWKRVKNPSLKTDKGSQTLQSDVERTWVHGLRKANTRLAALIADSARLKKVHANFSYLRLNTYRLRRRLLDVNAEIAQLRSNVSGKIVQQSRVDRATPQGRAGKTYFTDRTPSMIRSSRRCFQ